jgi:hypothetical protein
LVWDGELCRRCCTFEDPGCLLTVFLDTLSTLLEWLASVELVILLAWALASSITEHSWMAFPRSASSSCRRRCLISPFLVPHINVNLISSSLKSPNWHPLDCFLKSVTNCSVVISSVCFVEKNLYLRNVKFCLGTKWLLNLSTTTFSLSFAFCERKCAIDFLQFRSSIV